MNGDTGKKGRQALIVKAAIITAVLLLLAWAFVPLLGNRTAGAGDADGDPSLTFTTIFKSDFHRIVYNNETKVMYAVSMGRCPGIFTLLVNPDGTPMVYDGKG